MTDKTPANRPNRKASEKKILALNSLGYSVSGIGRATDCDPSTISVRLQQLGLRASDGRRAFMEEVCASFTEEQLNWIASQLGPQHSIKDYIRNLIEKEFPLHTGTSEDTPETPDQPESPVQ